jgi:hypothetical protein
MPINNASLKQKAIAFVQTIEKRKPEERKGVAHGTLAKDYNLLRKMTAELNPQLAPILPPEASLYDAVGGQRYSHESYDDICTFCQQIVNLLP